MGIQEKFIFAKRVEKTRKSAKIPYFTVILYKIPLTSIALWAGYWYNIACAWLCCNIAHVWLYLGSL